MTKQHWLDMELAIAARKERARIEAEIHRLMFSADATADGIVALSQLFTAIQPKARRFANR